MTVKFALCLAALAGATPCVASPLDTAGLGELTAERQTGLSQVEVPVGSYEGGVVPTLEVTGGVTMRAWRKNDASQTPYQVIAPLRAQLEAQGYEVVFECADRICGGFDFRYSTELLPEPAMHVDLGDFHWLTARLEKAGGEDEVVTLMASRSRSDSFVQVTHVGPEPEPTTAPTLSSKNRRDLFLSELETTGSATLEDLSFGTGAANLGVGNPESLERLAEWLGAHPDRNLTLVGHTDSQGSLSRNIELSEARAAAVRDRLVTGLGVDPARINVRGLGPKEPRASNATDEGRRLNRRVEVVLD